MFLDNDKDCIYTAMSGTGLNNSETQPVGNFSRMFHCSQAVIAAHLHAMAALMIDRSNDFEAATSSASHECHAVLGNWSHAPFKVIKSSQHTLCLLKG